jgi:hypothetical protein
VKKDEINPSSEYSNEDDLTVKLTEIVFMNAVIKTGLAKGVTTQNLMVRLALFTAFFVFFSIGEDEEPL